MRRVHLALLRVWKHVPRLLRRRVVRLGKPSYTVGSACAVEGGDGTILLVRQSYRDGWGLPGGLVDRREDIADCARREVREEVGLGVDIVGAPAVVVDSEAQRVDVVFRVRLASGSGRGDARPVSPEIVEARWHPVDDLPDLQPEAVAELRSLAAIATGADLAEGDDIAVAAEHAARQDPGPPG